MSSFWASMDRWNASTCSPAILENTASVMAMKGTAYGTSNTGKLSRSAASRTGLGTFEYVKPVPNPRPASPAPASRST